MANRNNDNTEQELYIIPDNYKDNLVMANGLSIRNLVEGVVFAIIIGLIIYFIPISVTKIKIILISIFGLLGLLFGIIGIKHYSVTEFIMIYFKYKKSPNTLNCDTTLFEREKDDNVSDDNANNESSEDETETKTEIEN